MGGFGLVGRFQLLREPLPLHVQFVELLVIGLGDGQAGRLLFLDRGGKLVELQLDFVELAADLVDVAQPALLQLPLLAEIGQAAAEIGHFLLDFLAPLLGVFFGFVGKLAVGKLQLHQPPLHLVDLLRHALQFHRQAAGGLVHEVDRLVGQKAVGDVAVREVRRGHQGRVLDLHAAVMGLVARLQPAKDGDRVLDRWLVDVDRLEASLQRGVLLDVLAILVQRRRADAAELAAGQGRLEQVGRVRAAFRPARADDRVQLVDEEHDVARPK